MNIYVGNISRNATEQDLKEQANPFSNARADAREGQLTLFYFRGDFTIRPPAPSSHDLTW
jgi:hypothetical protein